MVAAQKSHKKRPAGVQTGPSPKKIHLDNERSSRKRSRPITRLSTEDNLDSDEEAMNAEGMGGDDDEQVGDEMDIEGGLKSTRGSEAARGSHRAQKLLLSQRRASKPNYKLLLDAKRVWSRVRQKSIPTFERQKYVKELMDIIRGKVKDVVLQHDASRIVQSVVKYGGKNERDEIAGELKGKYRELAQNKYSKFLVTKLIRLSPSNRESILLEFQSHVPRLLLHREASGVLADAFELYANGYERAILLRDFYGKEITLFGSTSGSDREKVKKGLIGILEDLSVERRKRVLGAVRENLVSIFNNPDKGAVTHAVVHRVLWEYLLAINEVQDEVEQEKLRREIFESCQELLAEMVHTKDGSRVVREFLVHGTNKDRKQIIKVLKPHVMRMCADDEAQLVLFSAFDVIDDTKLIARSLLPDITSHVLTLSTTPQGRRVLFYILVPRSRRHFTPTQIKSLSETDGIRAKTSKKDDSVRIEEIRKAAGEALIEFVVRNGDAVARDTEGSLLVTEIMLYAEGDKSAAITTLLKSFSSPYPSRDAGKPHPIDLPHTSRMFKTLLQGGHYSRDSMSISRIASYSPSVFAAAMLKCAEKESIIEMAKGEGVFVVSELLERIKSEGDEEERSIVKGWFGEMEIKELKEVKVKGREVLLEKVQALW